MNKQELKIIVELLDQLQIFCNKEVDLELNDNILNITNQMPDLKREIADNNVCLGDLAYIMNQRITNFLLKEKYEIQN